MAKRGGEFASASELWKGEEMKKERKEEIQLLVLVLVTAFFLLPELLDFYQGLILPGVN